MRLRGWLPVAVAGLLLFDATAAVSQEAEPRRGWLGFTYVATEDNDGDHRVVIERVYPGSPAQRAGVRAGDRVLRWNGSADVGEVLENLRLEPGDTVRLRLRQDQDRDRDVVVVAGSRPPGLAAGEGRRRGPGPWGLSQEERAKMQEEWRRAQEELAELWKEGGPLSLEERRELQEELGKKQEEIARILREHARNWNFNADSLARFWRERVNVDSLAMHADSLQKELRFRLRTHLGPELQGLEDQVVVVTPEGTSTAVIALGQRSVAGAEFEEMNEGLSTYFGTDEGLLVLHVSEETPAGRAGLRPGDVVLSADGHTLDSVRDLRSAVRRAEGGRNRVVNLEVLREGRRQQLQLRWE